MVKIGQEEKLFSGPEKQPGRTSSDQWHFLRQIIHDAGCVYALFIPFENESRKKKKERHCKKKDEFCPFLGWGTSVSSLPEALQGMSQDKNQEKLATQVVKGAQKGSIREGTSKVGDHSEYIAPWPVVEGQERTSD
jgi:hypothetical protein